MGGEGGVRQGKEVRRHTRQHPLASPPSSAKKGVKMVKREIGAPIMIGAVIVVLGLVGFFYWRSSVAAVPHETPAPAKNPDDNPMFKGMRDSMKTPSKQNSKASGRLTTKHNPRKEKPRC